MNFTIAKPRSFCSVWRRCFGSFSRIPVVDVSGLVSSSSKSTQKEVGLEIHEACKNVGFLYVKNHGVSKQLKRATIELPQNFFSLPKDEKDKIQIRKSPTFRGYQNTGENVTLGKRDWHEAIDFMREHEDGHPLVVEKKPLHGPNQWPSKPTLFEPTFKEYVDRMLDLGGHLMRGIAMANNLPDDYFVPYFSDPFWVMRVIHYPLVEQTDKTDADEGMGCGEHTDYGFLTFLNQDHNKECLQVKNSAGEWINANPIEDAFVVNIGDMLRVWSRGMYQSTPHRVQHPSRNSRVSCAFFYEPGFDVVIAPEQSLGGTMDVKPVMYGDHLQSKIDTNFQFDS